MGSALAEERLRGEWNTAITQAITCDEPRRNIQWERSLDKLIESAFSESFPNCSIHRSKRKFQSIDICMVCDGQVTAAIECKGMVSNSHANDLLRNSLDVHGIQTKLHSDKRSSNSVEEDIRKLPGKLETLEAGPHFEIFVPIIYELYRRGGQAEWRTESKPWTTLPEYKNLRESLHGDLENWFHENYIGEFTLIHGAELIELREANRLWREQGYKHYPQFKLLEAYVSFFAFSRFVE